MPVGDSDETAFDREYHLPDDTKCQGAREFTEWPDRKFLFSRLAHPPGRCPVVGLLREVCLIVPSVIRQAGENWNDVGIEIALKLREEFVADSVAAVSQVKIG